MTPKNLQIISTPKLTDPNVCKRAKLDIGTLCNYKCYFCYYSNRLNETTSFETIKARIDKLYALGCRDFDLSGGEPTIHKDFFKILEYLGSLGVKVSCLTNGQKFSDFEFLKRAYDFGIKEILFSLHSTETRHEQITGIKGSFAKILKAIENAKKLGILVRLNSTICRMNCDIVDTDYFKLVELIKPFEMNFLPLNYFESTNQNEFNDYGILLGGVNKFIDNCKSSVTLKELIINVRYVPFCYMRGYETYVKGYLQHAYEPRDWNLCWYHYLPDTLENFRTQVLENRIRSYRKFDECLKCRFFKECDGIEPLSVSKPHPI